MTLTAAEARSLLRYEPESGRLSWRHGRPGASQGATAGCLHRGVGYVYVSVNRRRCLAHRLAWLITFGEWPVWQIDHVNGDRADNRLSNLRSVTNSQNQQNRRHAQANNASSGLLGVSKMNSKWRARIVKDGQLRYLGVYSSAEAAQAAYINAKREWHEAFAP